MQLPLGFLLASVIAYLSYRFSALSSSGALAAVITGTLVFGLGGLPWAVLLLLFFVSSSLLSRASGRRKSTLGEKYAKGARRDYAQVLANGGLGASLALAQFFFSDNLWPWLAFAGAMAAANADTWATELGVLSPAAPRLITSGKLVERGTSGGVTPLGYLAAAAGAALVGLGAVAFTPGSSPLSLLLSLVLAGLAGASVDSLLGATLQAMYTCPSCRKETERQPTHSCGTGTVHARGWRWLNNDVVNFICSLVGAGAAVVGWVIFLYVGV